MVVSFIDKAGPIAIWRSVGVAHEARNSYLLEVFAGQLTQDGVTRDGSGKGPVRKEPQTSPTIFAYQKRCGMVLSGITWAHIAREAGG